MTVSDLIEFLQKQPQDLPVAYQIYSENCLLEVDQILVVELGPTRADGWVANKRSNAPSQTYLLFPGN